MPNAGLPDVELGHAPVLELHADARRVARVHRRPDNLVSRGIEDVAEESGRSARRRGIRGCGIAGRRLAVTTIVTFVLRLRIPHVPGSDALDTNLCITAADRCVRVADASPSPAFRGLVTFVMILGCFAVCVKQM
jgi:hypothetical protein